MYKCSNCGKEYDKVGKKNLHEYHCTLKSGARVSPVKTETKSVTGEMCSHEWRLLGNSQAEYLARQKGFTKYCAKCEEIE